MHLPHIFRYYPTATESRSDFTASVTQDRKGQAVSREVLRLLARVCCEIAARSVVDQAGTGLGSQTVDRTVSAFPNPLLPPTTAASKTKLVYGYSVGAGLDVMLVGGLFMRAEYEYRRVTSDVETNINTVRAGLGYKF